MAEANGDDRLHELIVSVKEGLEKEILNFHGSLEKEIHSLRYEMTARFDTQTARLDRDEMLMRMENRWLTRWR